VFGYRLASTLEPPLRRGITMHDTTPPVKDKINLTGSTCTVLSGQDNDLNIQINKQITKRSACQDHTEKRRICGYRKTKCGNARWDRVGTCAARRKPDKWPLARSLLRLQPCTIGASTAYYCAMKTCHVVDYETLHWEFRVALILSKQPLRLRNHILTRANFFFFRRSVFYLICSIRD
jgi:hypothetical protein